MQYDQHEIRYGLDPLSNVGKRVGYLNPMKICEDEHTFKIGPDNDELKGMTPKEAHQHIEEIRKDFEARYPIYLGYTML
jgi:hypothetical protein